MWIRMERKANQQYRRRRHHENGAWRAGRNRCDWGPRRIGLVSLLSARDEESNSVFRRRHGSAPHRLYCNVRSANAVT